MKKLMTLTLGLAFLTGTVGTCFAQQQDQPKAEKKGKKKAKKEKKNKNKKEAPKA